MSQGNFVWYDFMAKDVEKAKAFYSETAGWKVQPWGDQGYTMWLVGEQGIGGVMDMPEQAAAMGAPPHWLAFISSSDVDATAARAKELGGQIYKEPFDIPNVGRAAVLADPQGAAFAAVQFSDPNFKSVDASTEGAFSWRELMTSDYEAALEFYSDLFGWKAGDTMDMDEMGVYQIFNVGEKMEGGMMNKPAEMPTSAWLYYVETSDLDAAVARVKSNGGQIVNGPVDVPGGRIAQFVDNQGGMCAFHQVTE